jgi:Ca2+-binding EF-hand superfamily protein
MRKPSSKVKLIVSGAVLLVTITVLGTAAAQKSSVPRAQDRLSLGEENVRQLLPLMDTDKNGMVSEQSYMKFMQAEFHRLDKKHQGELNAREMAQSNVSASNRFNGK